LAFFVLIALNIYIILIKRQYQQATIKCFFITKKNSNKKKGEKVKLFVLA